MQINEPALRVTAVSKSFGRKSVLKSIDGSIDHGKAVGLLGENGSGKTTLFRILLDSLMPDRGEVFIDGCRTDGTGEIRRTIGYIPERPSFHSFMTVAEVLHFRRSLYPRWNAEFVSTSIKHLVLDLNTRINAASKGTLAKLAWICATAQRTFVIAHGRTYIGP